MSLIPASFSQQDNTEVVKGARILSFSLPDRFAVGVDCLIEIAQAGERVTGIVKSLRVKYVGVYDRVQFRSRFRFFIGRNQLLCQL